MGTEPGILLATDGEPHSAAAVAWAIDQARARALPLTAVHVRDPYLKQFYNEIYAQGREEYLAHVDDCLAERAREVQASFEAQVQGLGVTTRFVVRDGDPAEVLIAECRNPEFGMLVLGRKPRRGGLAAWRSRGLPLKLTAAVTDIPLVIVPAAAPAE